MSRDGIEPSTRRFRVPSFASASVQRVFSPQYFLASPADSSAHLCPLGCQLGYQPGRPAPAAAHEASFLRKSGAGDPG